MLDVSIDADVTGVADDVRAAQRKRMEDSMAKGFAVSQERVPSDRGTLRQSGYTPTWDGNRIRFGYRADHAKPMEFGTQPFWPPTEPLLEWAERVIGDRSAGYAVQKKIAEVGISSQEYAKPGREAAQRFYESNSFSKYFDRRR